MFLLEFLNLLLIECGNNNGFFSLSISYDPGHNSEFLNSKRLNDFLGKILHLISKNKILFIGHNLFFLILFFDSYLLLKNPLQMNFKLFNIKIFF